MTGIPALDRLDWQATLFAPALNRLAVMRLGAPAATGPVLRVVRNHAFETLLPVLAPLMQFAGYAMSPVLGEYDDSLNLPDEPYDAALVWLDFSRYGRLDDDELGPWLAGRLAALRAHAGGPLVVANSPDGGDRATRLNAAIDDWATRTPAAAVLRLDRIAGELGARAFSEDRAAVTGTRYGDPLCLEAARTLVFDVLAPFHAAPIKALAVDLDNTLYSGVLGEDGPDGVGLTEGHAALQREIDRLASQGVLVSIVSKNEPADVQALFAARADFPLRPDRIASWRVGWGEKSDGVRAAAAQFNIAPDAFLLIDDNVGELVQVGSRHPGLRLLHAGGEAADTVRALTRYPGLPRAGQAFAGRAADLAANAERAAMAESAPDEEAYLAALKAELTFALDPVEDRVRLTELSRKTNQFNLALRRLDEVEVDRYLTQSDRCVVHIRLADRLADSGSVAVLFGRRADGVLIVDELCISCRALGRKLEDVMVTEAVRGAMRRLGADGLAFDYRIGPRNQPAVDWLAGFVGQPVTGEAGRLNVSADRVAETPRAAVSIRWTHD
ncbi:MAG: HAD-IIIC family phosphatase [Alphaproteobacteria bacterium]|nr:HAD-IIIC family phosphatase [Alphaproteobacteria bacterium]MBU1514507.1 HAD-IIIC family phosphatase [Alphaproteobacteria bacterium]MBU2096861.1 HAD-IIIC family phosphatase [Alphaproteobacteria bacterium]MBU2153488.1 HAD-IIIC family phosphatase [Alphaproteobacteria bacterium]MBU2306007.1 HAD-IIIC family phosphatase [Alphaproteobacteria bacterium]